VCFVVDWLRVMTKRVLRSGLAGVMTKRVLRSGLARWDDKTRVSRWIGCM
jgi:hypothetical protein